MEFINIFETHFPNLCETPGAVMLSTERSHSKITCHKCSKPVGLFGDAQGSNLSHHADENSLSQW